MKLNLKEKRGIAKYTKMLMPKLSFSFFSFFMAALEAYGCSWARGQREVLAVAYTTATATPDPNHFRNLHHSSQQHWTLNLMNRARDQTRVFMNTSRVRNLPSYNRNMPQIIFSSIAGFTLKLCFNIHYH